MEKKRCLLGRLNENKVILNERPAGFQNLQRKLLSLRNDKRGRSRIKYGMTSLFYNGKAFTLIELLVVVLIIGILAAVALPQYKFAVAKARMTQLVTLAKSVADAEEAYYLANGKYTGDWTVLDIDLSGNLVPTEHRIYVTGGWNARLSSIGEWVAVSDERIANLDMALYFNFMHTSRPGDKQCYAHQNNVLANELCQYITHRKTNNRDDGVFHVYQWND